MSYRLRHVKCPWCGYQTEIPCEVYSSECPSCGYVVFWEELPEEEERAEEEAVEEPEPVFPLLRRVLG